MPRHELVQAGTGESTKPAMGEKAPPAVASEGADPLENRGAGVGSSFGADAAAANLREQMIDLLPRLSAFAHCLSRDADESDDLVQETCVRALAHRDQRRPGTPLDSWMLRIAHNLWFARKGAEAPRGGSGDSTPIGDRVPSDSGGIAEGRRAVGEVLLGLDQLSSDDRALVALVCVDGLTYDGAAEVLGLPVATVMSRLARARLALHDVMNRGPTLEASRSWRGVVVDVSPSAR